MRVGERIAERRKALGISQGMLARLAGVSQGTIGKLEAGISSGSSHLHRIARALQTSPAYLAWETDDPDADAPPPPPPPAAARLMLEVTLPSEDALSAMFEGVLLGLDRDLPLDVQARLLAQSLPIAMSRLQGARPVPAPVRAPREDATSTAAALATHGPGERQ